MCIYVYIYAAHGVNLLKHFLNNLDLSTTFPNSIQRLPSRCCSVCNHSWLPCPACAFKVQSTWTKRLATCSCTSVSVNLESLFACIQLSQQLVQTICVASRGKASSSNTLSLFAHSAPMRCATCIAGGGGLLSRGAVFLAQCPAQQRHPSHDTRPASAVSAMTKAQTGIRPLPTQHPDAAPQRRTEE